MAFVVFNYINSAKKLKNQVNKWLYCTQPAVAEIYRAVLSISTVQKKLENQVNKWLKSKEFTQR